MLSGLKRFLRDTFTTPKVVRQVVIRNPLQARHEALDDENPDHWKNAYSTSPNGVSTSQRAKLRNKFRHERDNNATLDAMLEQYAGDFIGSGPRLQFNEDVAGIDTWAPQVERSFAKWSEAINLADKLTLFVESAPGDGASFLQALVNPVVDHPVKLDFRGLEDEQVATPDLKAWLDPKIIDGVVQDEFGNVEAYHVLREHPGDFLRWGAKYDTIPESQIGHWYRPTRAGQLRGHSRFASTLEDLAMIRRFQKATLAKQEAQACIVATMEVDAPAADVPESDEDPAASFKLADEVPMPRQGFFTVPKDSNVKQVEPSDTTTDYSEYVDKLQTQGGRPLLASRAAVTGDSSGYNFASGKLDKLPAQDSILRLREKLRRLVLKKIVKLWAAFALHAGEIPAHAPPFKDWVFDFAYDGFSSIDTLKDLDAAAKRITTGLSNLSLECAALGYDWKQIALQRKKEIAFYKLHGLDPTLGLGKVPAAQPAKPPEPEPEDEAETDTTLERRSAEGAYV